MLRDREKQQATGQATLSALRSMAAVADPPGFSIAPSPSSASSRKRERDPETPGTSFTHACCVWFARDIHSYKSQTSLTSHTVPHTCSFIESECISWRQRACQVRTQCFDLFASWQETGRCSLEGRRHTGTIDLSPGASAYACSYIIEKQMQRWRSSRATN